MSNPISELPEDFREVMTELRVVAELAVTERKAGRTYGPAMRRHMNEGMGDPELSLEMLGALDRAIEAAPVHQQALANVEKLSATTIEFANKMKAFINERPEYITALENSPGGEDADADYWRWSGGAEARRQLAEALNWTVPRNPGETAEPKAKVEG